MRIAEVLVESSELDEGPVWDKVKGAAGAVGKGIGAVGQGIGAIASVPQGLGRAIKKGYNAGVDTIGGGPSSGNQQQAPQGGQQPGAVGSFMNGLRGNKGNQAGGQQQQNPQQLQQLIQQKTQELNQLKAQLKQSGKQAGGQQPNNQQANVGQQPNNQQANVGQQPNNQQANVGQQQKAPQDNGPGIGAKVGNAVGTAAGNVVGHAGNFIDATKQSYNNTKNAIRSKMNPPNAQGQMPTPTVVDGGKSDKFANRKAALAKSKADREAGKGITGAIKTGTLGEEFQFESKFLGIMI